MNEDFKINIPRPRPETAENSKQIAFLEPLRVQGKVLVNDAYRFNLGQFNAGRECSWSPGFNYEFIFSEKEDATAFKLIFGGNEVK
jgi:hypothetical protein